MHRKVDAENASITFSCAGFYMPSTHACSFDVVGRYTSG